MKMRVTHLVPGAVKRILDIAIIVGTNTGVTTAPKSAATQDVNNAL